MSTNIQNQTPYLRTSRNFPLNDPTQLSTEINKAYVDIANNVNARTIGIFPTNKPIVTGESWYVTNNQRQQSLRQIYAFTTNADIDIGFKLSTIESISKNSYGSFTNGTSWFGVIYASDVAIPGQLSFFVTVNAGNPNSDVIRFMTGAGAPTITSGIIDLEWLSSV